MASTQSRHSREALIAAIRKLAAESGRAPGKMRFQTATGIPEARWLGVYWRSWSAALAEAGFSPNEMQRRLGDDLLLGHIAALCLKLGRWPAEADLRLERRADPTLPSHNTFARLGAKSERVERLREFVAARPELMAVVELLPAPIVSVGDGPGTVGPSESLQLGGYVYLVKMGKFYKIGRTNDLGRRLYELRTQLPERMELVHSIETDDPEGIERYWHARFADRRANGEWFALSREDTSAFKRRKQFM